MWWFIHTIFLLRIFVSEAGGRGAYIVHIPLLTTILFSVVLSFHKFFGRVVDAETASDDARYICDSSLLVPAVFSDREWTLGQGWRWHHPSALHSPWLEL